MKSSIYSNSIIQKQTQDQTFRLEKTVLPPLGFSNDVLFCQQYNEIDAQVDPLSGLIEVKQLFRYTNEASSALDTLYLYDWNHAYSTHPHHGCQTCTRIQF